jgi:hypothetical protein
MRYLYVILIRYTPSLFDVYLLSLYRSGGWKAVSHRLILVHIRMLDYNCIWQYSVPIVCTVQCTYNVRTVVSVRTVTQYVLFCQSMEPCVVSTYHLNLMYLYVIS